MRQPSYNPIILRIYTHTNTLRPEMLLGAAKIM